MTDLQQFESSFYARFEAAAGDDRKVGEREMLEQVQRWFELQRSGASQV